MWEERTCRRLRCKHMLLHRLFQFLRVRSYSLWPDICAPLSYANALTPGSLSSWPFSLLGWRSIEAMDEHAWHNSSMACFACRSQELLRPWTPAAKTLSWTRFVMVYMFESCRWSARVGKCVPLCTAACDVSMKSIPVSTVTRGIAKSNAECEQILM